jgi:hypothetical protein
MKIEMKGNLTMPIKDHLLEKVAQCEPKYKELILILLNGLNDEKSFSQIEDKLFSELNEIIEEENGNAAQED